jgi:hypothetical protein
VVAEAIELGAGPGGVAEQALRVGRQVAPAHGVELVGQDAPQIGDQDRDAVEDGILEAAHRGRADQRALLDVVAIAALDVVELDRGLGPAAARADRTARREAMEVSQAHAGG